MKYAIIDNGTVENLILWDGVTEYTPPQNTTLVNIDNIPCEIGWIQQPDGSFAAPENNA